MKLGHLNWLSADLQACINNPLVPINRGSEETAKECNTIKIKMLWYPMAATSKTYELKVPTFENGKPEEFLKRMKKFNTAIGRTGTTTKAGKPTIYAPY